MPCVCLVYRRTGSDIDGQPPEPERRSPETTGIGLSHEYVADLTVGLIDKPRQQTQAVKRRRDRGPSSSPGRRVFLTHEYRQESMKDAPFDSAARSCLAASSNTRSLATCLCRASSTKIVVKLEHQQDAFVPSRCANLARVANHCNAFGVSFTLCRAPSRNLAGSALIEEGMTDWPIAL